MPIEALSPYEVATGFPLGTEAVHGTWPSLGRVGAHGVTRPLQVLRSIVLEGLRRPPCLVLFSGGRDSSALLALAAHVARDQGLDLPVPLTVFFPGEAETEEGPWQELVVRSLGLSDWERCDGSQDADLLGPVARQVLRRYGVIWSPLLATRARYFSLATGGSLLSGEGGDEVFGPRRARALSGLARVRRPWQAAHLARSSLASMLPRPWRRGRIRQHLAQSLGLEWLRPAVRDDFLEGSAAQWADEPLAWGRSVKWLTSCRHVRLSVANMAGLASEADVFFAAPFLGPGFLDVLASAFGPLGPENRSAAMRALFGPLLPEALLARRSKAVFTLPAWGPWTKEFIANWGGDGIDDNLVDVEALRRHWAGERPSAMTFGLVQQAWLLTR